MKLKELNESSTFDLNFEGGIIVYLNKRDRTFAFADTSDATQRGLTFTIKSKRDYDKLSRYYDIAVSHEDFVKLSNNYKKNKRSRQKNKDVTEMDKEISRALSAMHRDLMRMAKKK